MLSVLAVSYSDSEQIPFFLLICSYFLFPAAQLPQEEDKPPLITGTNKMKPHQKTVEKYPK